MSTLQISPAREAAAHSAALARASTAANRAPNVTPCELFGLPVLSRTEATEQGYTSVTHDTSLNLESGILQSLCQGRSPERCCLIQTGTSTYQLAIKSQYIVKLS
jgi:hypothetical protein